MKVFIDAIYKKIYIQIMWGEDEIELKGFGGAGVLELVEDHRGDTYRAVYTVRFAAKVYVLHVFQKKARHGIATPKHELDLIRARLKQAEGHYKETLI
jgi:phage-related protein